MRTDFEQEKTEATGWIAAKRRKDRTMRMDTDVTGGTLHLTAEARWTQSGRPYGVEFWRASFGSLSCIVFI